MFRHNKLPDSQNQNVVESKEYAEAVVGKESLSVPENETSLKELIEKNLKWSQIIYEQNRKLNNKLLWLAASSWLKILILIIPLVVAGIFLPPLLKTYWSQYGELLGISSNSSSEQQTKPANSLDGIIKVLNLDPAKQEQLKALLK